MLKFPVEFLKPVKSQRALKIRNTGNSDVAYKVKTNAPDFHIVQPPWGYIGVGGEMEVLSNAL